MLQEGAVKPFIDWQATPGARGGLRQAHDEQALRDALLAFRVMVRARSPEKDKS